MRNKKKKTVLKKIINRDVQISLGNNSIRFTMMPTKGF